LQVTSQAPWQTTLQLPTSVQTTELLAPTSGAQDETLLHWYLHASPHEAWQLLALSQSTEQDAPQVTSHEVPERQW
jgi:hypothetical protein